MAKNLLEKSDIYYKESDVYQRFADVEDAPDIIFQTLASLFAGKKVLDMGCGTGKYPVKFAPIAESITGFDAAAAQIDIANSVTKDLPNVSAFTADATTVQLPENEFDILFSSWMLSTITDADKRKQIFEHIEKSLKPNAQIFFIENYTGGQFEDIRGRVNDPLERTKQYNDWLIDQGFKIFKKIDTYFEFDSLNEARAIFGAIWGLDTANKINSKKVEHKVLIFNKTITKE